MASRSVSVDAHNDAQVRIVADGLGYGRAYRFQLAQHGVLIAFHDDEFRILGHLGEDAVEQVVVVIAVHPVDVMVAQLKLHLLGQLGQEGVLGFGRQLGEHEVAFRLPGPPDLLEGAGIEYGKGHEVFRVKALLVIVEVAFRILHAGVLLSLLQHLTAPQAGQADFLLHAGNDHDKAFLNNLVARGGERQKLFQYLAAVIGVLYYYCHCPLLVKFVFDFPHALVPRAFPRRFHLDVLHDLAFG